MSDTVNDFRGRIVWQEPPSDRCQKVYSTSFQVWINGDLFEISLSQDNSPDPKPVYVCDVSEPSTIEVSATVDVEFFETHLKTGVAPKDRTAQEQTPDTVFLQDGFLPQEDKSWFLDYLSSNKLVPEKGETDITFARRILQFMGSTYKYSLEPGPHGGYQNADPQSAYAVTHCGHGECWALSSLYAEILREAGIPVRQVSGNWVGGGHHLRDLVWLDRLGWVPVDPSNACQIPDPKDPLKYFGYWDGEYLCGNRSLGISLPFGDPISSRNLTWLTVDTVMYLRPEGPPQLSAAPFKAIKRSQKNKS